MLKTSTIAACVLALSGSAALAQTDWMTGWLPPAPSDAAGGANGPARVRSIGGDPNVADTGGGQTTSSSVTKQIIKTQSAAGANSAPGGYYYYGNGRYRPAYGTQAQALTSDEEPVRGPHRVYITDEYGFKYDRQGNRLNAQGYVISPHAP